MQKYKFAFKLVINVTGEYCFTKQFSRKTFLATSPVGLVTDKAH